jgi:hypothetical protein
LERAEVAEGGFEAILVKLASERHLDERERRLLGCFREAYQTPREMIRENKRLEWWSTVEPRGHRLGFEQYRAFKALAEFVAFLLEQSPRHAFFLPWRPRLTSSEAIAALRAITIRDDKWWETATKELALHP